MKRQIFLLGLVAMFFPALPLRALENKTFTEDGTINPGEAWNLIDIHDTPPNHTTVDMLGGTADFISTYDESTLNIFNGSTQTEARDYSTVNVYGGNHSGIGSSNYSISNFYSGAFSRYLASTDAGIANMYGGVVESIGCGENGIVNLYGGEITDSIGASDSSTVNIFGYNFTIIASGGEFGDGYVSGFWADMTPFTIDLYNSYQSVTYEHIVLHEIPEPASLGLFLLGTLICARKRA